MAEWPRGGTGPAERRSRRGGEERQRWKEVEKTKGRDRDMERERDGRRGGNDRHKEMETDPEMETDTQRKWGRRMRERRRGKGRREGKTKRDGAEMVSQTDRGRKTQNETEGEAQTRETQRVGRRQPSEGKRGAGETWRQVSKQGSQKWERQVRRWKETG